VQGPGAKLFDPECLPRFHVSDLQVDVARPEAGLAGLRQLRVRRNRPARRRNRKVQGLRPA
jgi:hypothetical protein